MLLVESIHGPQCPLHYSRLPWLTAMFITVHQGLDSLDEFHPLVDDEVENSIKVTRCPGGTIPNPAPIVADAPALSLIPNPGCQSLYMQKTTCNYCVTFISTWNGPQEP